jgi:hypothetical protein
MNYLRWLFINMIIPLSPLMIRIFVFIFGNKQSISSIRIIDLPELIFYSIFLCIVNLNTNTEGPKNNFEMLIRFFMYLLIVFDSLILGMIYSNNFGDNIQSFIIFSVAFPFITTPIYKFFYRKIEA